jgi:hypothetical protein
MPQIFHVELFASVNPDMDWSNVDLEAKTGDGPERMLIIF